MVLQNRKKDSRKYCTVMADECNNGVMFVFVSFVVPPNTHRLVHSGEVVVAVIELFISCVARFVLMIRFKLPVYIVEWEVRQESSVFWSWKL
jgi:hypothetical protein